MSCAATAIGDQAVNASPTDETEGGRGTEIAAEAATRLTAHPCADA
ncbi:hypothetical protein [Streptomyces globisporus]